MSHVTQIDWLLVPVFWNTCTGLINRIRLNKGMTMAGAGDKSWWLSPTFTGVPQWNTRSPALSHQPTPERSWGGSKRAVLYCGNLSHTDQPYSGLYSLVQVNLIGLHAGLVSGRVGVPAVHLELLDPGLSCRGCSRLGITHRLVHRKEEKGQPLLIIWCQESKTNKRLRNQSTYMTVWKECTLPSTLLVMCIELSKQTWFLGRKFNLLNSRPTKI